MYESVGIVTRESGVADDTMFPTAKGAIRKPTVFRFVFYSVSMKLSI